jgi:hypothetical protein
MKTKTEVFIHSVFPNSILIVLPKWNKNVIFPIDIDVIPFEVRINQIIYAKADLSAVWPYQLDLSDWSLT